MIRDTFECAYWGLATLGLGVYTLFMLRLLFPESYRALLAWLAARWQNALDWIDRRRWQRDWNHLLDDAE